MTTTKPITLDELQVYIRCPLEWFWERRAGVPRPRTPASLLPLAMQSALAFYYENFADSLEQAVGLVWGDWCRKWGEPALAEDLIKYAIGRAKILDQFAQGLIRNVDGKPYLVPQMTAKYRDLMFNQGLTKLGRRLDEFAKSHGLFVAEQDNQVGSALGDAFADCIMSAKLAGADPESPLPASDVVLGLQIPYRVDLGSGRELIGTADLVRQAVPEAGEGAVVLEIHDALIQPAVRASWAGRDVRVIASFLAQPLAASAEDAEPVTWQRVERVIYRHWLSGQSFNFREVNVGHLSAVLAAAARGMRHAGLIPRALSGYDFCRGCAYRDHCWSEGGWDTLTLVDPGLVDYAEQLRLVTQRVRQAIGSDDRAAQRTRQALTEIEAAALDLQPDLSGEAVQAVLTECQHELSEK